MKLLQDIAPAYTARTTTAYLNDNPINLLRIPSKSSDIYIIKTVCNELNRRVRKNIVAPQPTLSIVLKLSHTPPQSYLYIYVTSMRRRC